MTQHVCLARITQASSYETLGTLWAQFMSSPALSAELAGGCNAMAGS